MKIAVVGAGSIGGYLGTRLALAGEDVTFIARRANLEAIRSNGMKLIEEDGTERIAREVRVTQNTQEAGTQDVVLLAVKAHQVSDVAKDLRPMFGPETVVLTLQNGVPWWYFYKHGGDFEGRSVRSVDPDGVAAASIENERIVGCVVYPAAELIAPGVVKVVEGNRFPIGEPDGSESPRARTISDALTRADLKSPILPDIRSEIWLKLWGNLTFNPISALTHATLVDICQFPLSRDLAAGMMSEAQAVAEKLNIRFRVTLEKRIAGAEKVGKHKTSMLQDIEHGRAIELEALVGSVVEMGRLTGTPTPHIDAVYACAALLARTLAEEKGRLRVQPL
ncbi:MAG TPA: 2-dehydropantoate 2-reductase [Burkholderiales bacterium]